MARETSAPVTWLQYLAARFAVTVATSFNVDTTHHLARQVAKVAYRMDRRHRERCRQNIAFAFPEYSEARVEQMVRQSFEYLAMLAMDVIHTPRQLNLDTWANHVQIRNIGPALELLNADRPVILITGHLGNWEALAFILGTLGYEMEPVARPLDNPLINRWLLGIREKRGIRIIEKFNAVDRMKQVLDEHRALGFTADQDAGPKGHFVPYFNRLASAYKAIGVMATRKNAPVICGCAHRVGDDRLGLFRFELRVEDIIYPEDWAEHEDPQYYITARYMRAIEQMVRRRPEQHLWMHRRWKSRPRYERDGQPMPDEMRRKLMSLPWITEADLDPLSKPPPTSAR